MVSYVDYFTLANSYGFENMTTDSKAGTWVNDLTIIKSFYYFFDLGGSTLIVFFIFVFKVYSSVIRKSV
jgi:hypothetical protein